MIVQENGESTSFMPDFQNYTINFVIACTLFRGHTIRDKEVVAGNTKPLHFTTVSYIYENKVKWLYRPVLLKMVRAKKKNESI